MRIELMKTEEEVNREIEFFKQTHRCVKVIGEYPNITISGKEPCFVCDKFHRLNSNAEKRCGLAMVRLVAQTMVETDNNE